MSTSTTRMIASYEELKSSPGGLSLPLFTLLPRRGVLRNSKVKRHKKKAGAARPRPSWYPSLMHLVQVQASL